MVGSPDLEDYFGDYPFDFETTVAQHPADIILKSITLLVAICAGTAENALLIYVIVRDRKLHRAPYYFMINLAVADMIRSIVCLPVILATVLHGFVWSYSVTSCILLAFASNFLEFGAVFALFVLAVDRHISVTHQRFHARRLRGLMCLGVVLVGWGVSFLLAFPPVFGLGTYTYRRQEAQCTFQHRYYTDNDTMGFTVIFLVILVLVLFTYLRIFVFLRARRKMCPVTHHPPRSSNWNFYGANMLPLNNFGNLGNLGLARLPTNPISIGQANAGHHVTRRYPGISSRSERSIERSRRLVRVFICVTLLYVLLWLPYILVSFWYMFDPQRRVPERLVAIATWLTYIQVALVPLVYVVGHQPFRQSLCRAMGSASHADGYVTTDTDPDVEA